MAAEENVWEKLGRPKYVVAPMVDASELAWRLLSRRHGAQLCYSPMFHSAVFIKDPKYRKEALAASPEDRPLIIQFCGNKAEIMVEAAKLAEPYCDAIDINLGCPQAIAKRGNYGAFLQEEWELLTEIVRSLRKALSVPVTCKMRVFECVEKTVEYAKMLEAAGCQMLTVHGRTREQKGPLTGIASWRHIKAVKENVKIPVLANGNIQCLPDLERCLSETGCDGVMTAEGNLYNPFIFEGTNPPVWVPSVEYLDLVREFPCPLSYIRGHLFKILKRILALPDNADLREEIGKGCTVDEFKETLKKLRDKYEPIIEGTTPWAEERTNYDLELPPFLCQSYVRMSPEDHLKKMETIQEQNRLKEKEILANGSSGKREREVNGEVLSKKKMKKLLKGHSPFPHSRREVEICLLCLNPMGLKCNFNLCKTCCRSKCYNEELDCVGHRILIKTRRLTAREKASEAVR